MLFTSPPALAINHIEVTVPDIHAAIDWYGTVLGFRCIMGPRVLETTEHTEAAPVFGNHFRRAWQAHLLSGNSVGVELFQFIEPPTRGSRSPHELVPWLDRGLWHLCITHPNVPAMVEHGGTLLTPPNHFVPGRPWTLAYTTDPWGTMLAPTITQAVTDAGRPHPRIIAIVPVAVTDDAATVRAAVADKLAFYDQIPSYQKVLAREGVSGAAELAVIGTAQTVTRQLKTYLNAGATDVALMPLQTELTDLKPVWDLAAEL